MALDPCHVFVGPAINKHAVGCMGWDRHGSHAQSIAAHHSIGLGGAQTITRVGCVEHNTPNELYVTISNDYLTI